MKRRARRGQKRCYLCGAREDLTKDHIPPKCLFPRPRPTNLLTLPCCRDCNNRASRDDEYLRLATSGLINALPAGRRAWQRVVESTLPSRRIAGLIDEVRRQMKPSLIETPVGDIQCTEIWTDARPICRSLVRMTRGFLSLSHPEVDSTHLDFEITHINQFKQHSLVSSGVAKALKPWVVGDGVYALLRGVASDDSRFGLQMHIFYGAAIWALQHKAGTGKIELYGGDQGTITLDPMAG